jgi:hypothetical protein
VIVGDAGFGVCQLPAQPGEAACHLNSDCAVPLVCAIDLQCRTQCATDRDCTSTQVCRSTVCYDATGAPPP